MKSNWDKAASNYVDIIGETGSHSQRTYITPAMLEMVGNIKDKKVLDLGCGEGYFSRKVAELGAEVTGIDISAELVKIAKEKEKRKSLGIKYHNLSSESLDGIKDSSFDLIVSNMVLHNVKNLEATFAECSRVLKNNGRLIFVIIHPLVDTMKMASFDNDLQGFSSSSEFMASNALFHIVLIGTRELFSITVHFNIILIICSKVAFLYPNLMKFH
ncbi:MAG: class I SAM-dependent methyltransferase [Candidatus Micrarchaeota archaeon]